MQSSTLLEYFVVAASRLCAMESQVDDRLAHVKITNRDVRQPLGQIRIDEQKVQGSVRIQSQNRLDHAPGRGGGPGLRRVRVRVVSREWMVEIARMPREQLGQAVEVEQRRSLE